MITNKIMIVHSKNMKFLILTDLHGKKSAIEWINTLIEKQNIDCVLFLGDAIAVPGPAEESAEMIGMIKCKRILAIPGNVDDRKLPDILDTVSENMHGIGKEIDGIHIAGFGGSNPTIFGTPSEFPEEEIYEALDKISKENMILMVHAPAYGINDVIPSGLSVGSKSILEIAKKYKPLAVLSGHIHESFGKQVIDGTIFVNPGPAMEGRYAIMETDGTDIDINIFGPLD